MISRTRKDNNGDEYTFKSEIDSDACFECGKKDLGVEEEDISATYYILKNESK